ncbi:DUF6445 family protein [Asticcacaulis sp. AC402]|uniref:DUF6445 family protein n=1 Tax=Asticcacaulis sp. AC402 TaxID=1282361 RepID=UPI0003C3E72E|nr:DUF6445 family protein [Asticcacaulis sp. AC402]ESQ77456.1 hypothetical protein ABAC402_01250 [Asticcacaulis sp. AC402]
MAADIALNPNPHIEIWKFGHDNEPVFIADNVLADPDALLASARMDSFGAPPQKSWYPGLVAPVPDLYRKIVLDVLRRPMAQVFGMHPDYNAGSYGFFGLTTQGPDDMSPNQVAPHTDTHRLHSFATVHYLSHGDFGGTAFYRHKSTGFELITPSRSAKFAHFRRQELAERAGKPLSEIRDLYEEIAYVEPRFNRLILYRAGQLHCAKMGEGIQLSKDPAAGRLTANLFFNSEG